jgi:hypothetical protein
LLVYCILDPLLHVHSIDDFDTDKERNEGGNNQEPVIWNRKNKARTNSITLLYLSRWPCLLLSYNHGKR